jgi:hypothetical protein
MKPKGWDGRPGAVPDHGVGHACGRDVDLAKGRRRVPRQRNGPASERLPGGSSQPSDATAAGSVPSPHPTPGDRSPPGASGGSPTMPWATDGEPRPAHRWVDGRRTDGLVPMRSRTGTNGRPDRRSSIETSAPSQGPKHDVPGRRPRPSPGKSSARAAAQRPWHGGSSLALRQHQWCRSTSPTAEHACHRNYDHHARGTHCGLAVRGKISP